ncbi:MAG: cysteine desulfurase NifS [Firmicutes bacterium]|nr:cysteine desulfurase NifS [Bacillota bacterium]
MRQVYLDNAATTPMHPQVVEAMARAMATTFGNPSSIHAFGQAARRALEEGREQVAALLGAEPGEVVFTGGGTEADNLAILGVARANAERGRHIITSMVEHHAVLHACQALEKEGFRVTYLPVDAFGAVRPEDLERALTDDTILVTIMAANNEVGTVQPIAEIARLAHKRDAYVHTDAVQAVGQMPVDVQEWDVDLLSLTGHKFYGPKGVGALYVRRRTRILPTLHGGGQERGLRSGTQNVPGVVGLAKAAELARAELPQRAEQARTLRRRLWEGIKERVPDVSLNGPPELRLPGNLSLNVHGVEGETLLLNLDRKGIALSAGSACTAGALEPSHVLKAMGVPVAVAMGALRFSLGRGNTKEDVNYVLEQLPPAVAKLRSLNPKA